MTSSQKMKVDEAENLVQAEAESEAVEPENSTSAVESTSCEKEKKKWTKKGHEAEERRKSGSSKQVLISCHDIEVDEAENMVQEEAEAEAVESKPGDAQPESRK
ncbi:hypothetical protein KOW79_006142 [Hemibagrus wyckioides]|uniref:Uncharacterized protein n=1 Tax=Hemibagrus wyckioides TaxID=337641 RepID=A0A9D3NW80_9TELE|nr:hypothetical protein KOW79_006142 [Hemibagrus wyckioides]